MRTINSKAFKKAMIDADCDTFGALEERTGINRTSLSDYAKGAQKPTYESMAKLADALCLKYEEIGSIFFYNQLAETEEN